MHSTKLQKHLLKNQSTKQYITLIQIVKHYWTIKLNIGNYRERTSLEFANLKPDISTETGNISFYAAFP